MMGSSLPPPKNIPLELTASAEMMIHSYSSLFGNNLSPCSGKTVYINPSPTPAYTGASCTRYALFSHKTKFPSYNLDIRNFKNNKKANLEIPN